MPLRSLVLHRAPEVRDVLLAALGRRGHRAVGTGDPDGVLTTHAEHPFALVLMGWGVAGWSGEDLLRALLHGMPQARRPLVVALAEGDSGPSEEAMLDAGATDVLRWPTTPERLIRRIRLTERWALEGAQRRDAEDALRRASGGFRALLDRLPDGVAVHRRDRLAYVNAAYAALLGHRDPAELVGRSLLEACADPRTIQSRVARGEAGDAALVARDGERVPVAMVHLPVDFEGAPATLTHVRDLRSQRTLEAGLLQADRMASVGTLALGVAHELNNPLASVSSNLQLLRELLTERRDAFPGEIRRQLEAMVGEAREGARRMRHVMRDLETFSRVDGDPRAPVSVEPVLRACVHMARNAIVHHARLELDFREAPRVDANESRLAQVFLALLVHSAHSMREADAAHNLVRVSCFTGPEGHAVVEVSDNGVGIDADELAHLFDPFRGTRSRAMGTGFGLSIAQNVVRGLGGTIEVDSERAGGTCFTVRLPASSRAVRSRRPSDTSLAGWAPEAPARPGRVLVIDDDPLVAKTIRRVLRRHDVVVAEGGAAALEALAGGDHWDVVLCDLMMPDVSGMDVFEHTVARRPALRDRFVFMTGGAFTPAARRFVDEVPNPCLSKPFDTGALRRLVDGRVEATAGSGPRGAAGDDAAAQPSGGPSRGGP